MRLAMSLAMRSRRHHHLNTRVLRLLHAPSRPLSVVARKKQRAISCRSCYPCRSYPCCCCSARIHSAARIALRLLRLQAAIRAAKVDTDQLPRRVGHAFRRKPTRDQLLDPRIRTQARHDRVASRQLRRI